MLGYQWPRCTVPGCPHVRTWSSEYQAQLAMARFGAEWVDHRTGAAVCYCHGAKTTHARFPCDQSRRA